MHYVQLNMLCAFIILIWWHKDTHSLSARCATHMQSFCVVLNRVLNPKVIVETRAINLCPLGPHQREIYNHRPVHYVCVTVCISVCVCVAVLVQYKQENMFVRLCMCVCVSLAGKYAVQFHLYMLWKSTHLSRQLHNNNEGNFSPTEWLSFLF